MATKEQYEYFKDRFGDELERKNALLRKTQLYFSVITVIASLIFTNLSKLDGLTSSIPSLKITLPVIFCILFLILVSLIYSVRMQNYSPAINIDSYLDELPTTNEEQTNEDFFDNRIAEFIAAIEINQETNNKKASFLKISEYGMLGFLFIQLMISLQIILQ